MKIEFSKPTEYDYRKFTDTLTSIENERLKDEILRLKAKLYDMMVERS